jgi:hypothetical protein
MDLDIWASARVMFAAFSEDSGECAISELSKSHENSRLPHRGPLVEKLGSAIR